MSEIKFVSKDGIIYKGEIQDCIYLTKKQKTKLKILASQKHPKKLREMVWN